MIPVLMGDGRWPSQVGRGTPRGVRGSRTRRAPGGYSAEADSSGSSTTRT